MAVFVLRTVNVVTPIEGDVKAIVVIAKNDTDARLIAGRVDDIFLNHGLSVVLSLGMSIDDHSAGVVAVEKY